MKMSDVFELPVCLGEDATAYSVAICDKSGPFGIVNKQAFNGAALAINNHDKLVESLREVIDLSKSPREHKEARERASKLLAELENNDAQRDW